MNVYSSIILNSKKVEIIQMSVNDEWIHNPYDGISFCLKRKKVLIHVTSWINFENMLSEKI